MTSGRPLTLRLAGAGHALLGATFVVLAVWLAWLYFTSPPCEPATRENFLRVEGCYFAKSLLLLLLIPLALLGPPYLGAGVLFWVHGGSVLRVAYWVAVSTTAFQLFLMLAITPAVLLDARLRLEPQYHMMWVYAVILVLLTAPLLSGGAQRFISSGAS